MTPFNATAIHAARLELVNLRAHVDAALTSLEAVLGDQSETTTDLRSGKIDMFVEANSSIGILDRPAAALTATPTSAVDSTLPKKPRKERDINGATPQRAALDEQIVAVVRAHQPISPGKVADRVGGKPAIVKGRVQLLVRSGRLIAEGATIKRVLRVPSAGSKPVAMPASTAPSTRPDSVEPPEVTAQRDGAILSLIRRGTKTFEEILSGLPTKPAHLSADDFRLLVKRSLRRLSMRGQVVDIGDKFKAA
jgi:hypothetical protein